MGPYLSAPIKEKQISSESCSRIQYASGSMQGIILHSLNNINFLGWRNSMEDAEITKLNLIPDVHLFGVFDGHGGREVSYFCKSHFAQELKSNVAFKKLDYKKALSDTFMKMDELLQKPTAQKELLSYRSSNNSSEGSVESGCTANVVLITKSDIYIANAGDSRSVLCNKGQAIEMSYDHKPDNELEKQRIHAAGGTIIEGRINGNLNLSRAIGDLEYKSNPKLPMDQQLISAKPDLKAKSIAYDDEFLVMGCDGIWESMSNQEIINFVRERINKRIQLTTIVEQLLDKCLAPDTTQQYGLDNMTCIIINFKK